MLQDEDPDDYRYGLDVSRLAAMLGMILLAALVVTAVVFVLSVEDGEDIANESDVVVNSWGWGLVLSFAGSVLGMVSGAIVSFVPAE